MGEDGTMGTISRVSVYVSLVCTTLLSAPEMEGLCEVLVGDQVGRGWLSHWV
jgi:hypothetical protein